MACRAGSRGGVSSRPAGLRRQRGFTLIELLVTIGVIGLLVTILIPSLQRAREQAKSAVCQSNLHQLWQLLHVVEKGQMKWPSPNGWLEFVNRQGAGNVVICPNDEGDATLADLEEVYLVQNPGGLEYYPILECIERGDQWPCRNN